MKKTFHVFVCFFFLQFYEPPDLGKKIFTTWNALKSEIYLTCINFWKFHNNLKAYFEVIRSQSWSYIEQKMWNFMSKYNFFRFWPPEKSVFELTTNLKFSFSESGAGSFHIPQKPIFLFKFLNIQGYPRNAPNPIFF